MKHPMVWTLCMALCCIGLCACSSGENSHILLPWEKENAAVGSVSDKTVEPTIPEQDDSLPYWIIPVSREMGSVFYMEEEDRNMAISRSPQAYNTLKQASWNSEDPDVLSNGNIQTLVKTLSQMTSAQRPAVTYSQMKVEGLCSNIGQYLGDCMWWDVITVKECKIIKDETADKLNGGAPYALVTAETYFQETIYLYFMDAESGEAYYSNPDVHNIEGYPVGVSQDAIVLCMVPFEAAGG